MSGIPQDAIDAVYLAADEAGLHLHTADVVDLLEAAEAVWPHEPPEPTQQAPVTGQARGIGFTAGDRRTVSRHAP